MATYTVYLKTFAETSVKVEAEDPDEAPDKAYDVRPTICAQCSGWGRNYNLELGDVWEAYEVTDAEDKVVWEDRPKKQD
jgi:hypothetical protein